MKPLTEDHLAIYRRHMVEVMDIHFDLMSEELGKSGMDKRLRAALLKVPPSLRAARTDHGGLSGRATPDWL